MMFHSKTFFSNFNIFKKKEFWKNWNFQLSLFKKNLNKKYLLFFK